MNNPSLRVCSFESRRQQEMARLIEKFGGIATVAPSMREIPLDQNIEALNFAKQLVAGGYDIVIFMTGVGTDALYHAVESEISNDLLSDALRQTTIAVRGPKPTAALAKRRIVPNLRAPEPNTWRELAEEFEIQLIDLTGKHIAIQEYGLPNREFEEWLTSRGANVTSVTIYRWALPEDTQPLEDAIKSTIAKEFDLVLWTSAQQVVHAEQIATTLKMRDEWVAATHDIPQASIGPTCSERMREFGIEPFMEPSHPKMAHLVREAIAAVTNKPNNESQT